MKKNRFIKRNELVSLKGNNLSLYARKTLDYIYKNAVEIYTENRNKGIFELDIIQLKKEIGMNRTTDHSQIISELEKINNLKFETFDNKYYSSIPILAGFQVLDNNLLRVALSPFLIEIIFDEEKPYYHIADLMEYKPLKSKYSKIILDLYNRYKPTEIPKMSKDEFKELLNYSDNYRNNDIKKYVLEQAQKELEKYNNLILKWEFFPSSRKWTEIKISMKKLKKEILLDTPIPVKLKASLGEKDLQRHEKKLKDEIEIIIPDPVIELVNITKKDYENLYRKYLEQLGEKHNLFIRKTFDFINKAKYKIIEDDKQEYIQTKIYTIEDIDESLLVSKTGKKLVGNARNIKAQKLLDELNKNGSV